MSYLERAVFDFTKSVLTDGFKTLLTKKYLPYTLTALVIIVFNSLLTFSELIKLNLITPQITNLLITVEIALATAFIIVGLFFSRLSNLMQLIIIFISTPIFTWIFSIPFVSENILNYIVAFYFIAWLIVSSFSEFSFMRDLLGNYVFGGVLFLGKPKDDGKLLFGGIVAVITIINIGIGFFLVTRYNNSVGLSILGFLIMLVGVINLIPLLNLQRSGDVFFTSLGWYYSLNVIRAISLIATLLFFSNNATSSSLISTAFTLFLVLFAVHKAAQYSVKLGKKVSLKDQLLLNDDAGREKRPELGLIYLLSRLFKDRGIVLLILGFVLGFHTTQLQIRLRTGTFFSTFILTEQINPNVWSNQIYLYTGMTIYLFMIGLFFFSKSFRDYANPSIYRAEWLPPYEDMKDLIYGIKRGEVDYKTNLLKMTGGMIKDQLGKKLLGRDTKHEQRINSTLKSLINKRKNKK